MTRFRIVTPSRLHFGLFGWGNSGRREFGGLGLMIDDPGIDLSLEPAPTWSAEGPLADRALAITQTLAYSVGSPLQFRVKIHHAPAEHVGLGVGTQLSLAIARGLTTLSGNPDLPIADLTRMTGRGLRSGVGTHGFVSGGFLVDAGRPDSLRPPTKVLRVNFPEDWQILLVTTDSCVAFHGTAEVDAFSALPPVPPSLTQQLCTLSLLNLIPAIEEHDLGDFGRALTELQRIVGRSFSPAQGGLYSNPQAEQTVKVLNEVGLVGVGQSSWGPTLYGFTSADLQERDSIARSVKLNLNQPNSHVYWSRANNRGAVWFH